VLRATGLPAGIASNIASWAVPFIGLSSGTIGNNGALSAITALPTTYTGGAWVLVPAGAIAAGIPAAPAWLWCVFSSATAGTIFNSTYTTGVPGLGTATPFATTGPGAFVATIAETTGPLITIPGGLLGPNGTVCHQTQGSFTSSGGIKTYKVKYSGAGGTAIYTVATATGTTIANIGYLQNRGATNLQVSGNNPTYVAETVGMAYTTADTTAATSLAWTFTRNTVTDNQILERAFVSTTFAP
jgi:hypothetical protein